MTAMPPSNFDPMHFCVAHSLPTEVRRQWIETAAYFKAQQRGFTPGHEAEDWRAAELEIDTQIARQF
jgi:Protein of unknown function (DUF2934)